MSVGRTIRTWWTQSDHSLLLCSQGALLETLVSAPAAPLDGGPLNGVQFRNDRATVEDTLVLAHGFGSGLGFFYSNVDPLLRSNRYSRVMLVDWLGMGGSERPACRDSPIRSGSFCSSRFSPSQAVRFFTEPLHELLETHGVRDATLVGHSLGGYLAARYVLQHPERINRLVLASPVGFPSKPRDALPASRLPPSFRLLDALWSANATPQQLVRLMGGARGRKSVARALRGRIPHLPDSASNLLAEYLYNITVAHPSGEFAMNSLLEPAASPDSVGVFAREPLEDLISNKLDPSIHLKVLFGDTDWMRSDTNERAASRVVSELQARNAPSIASMHVIANAGHHLYLDNAPDFVSHVLSDSKA